MESRIGVFLLKGCVGILMAALLPATALAADAGAERQRQVVEPQLDRREISTPKIDTENFELGLYMGLLSIEDFGTSVVKGGRVAYHITEGFFLEGAFGGATAGETSFERLTNIQLASETQRYFFYYNASIGYHLLPGEAFVGRRWAFQNYLYFIAGIGNTRFFDDDRFTVNYGIGYRILLTDWLAFRLDARDHMFDMDVLGVDKTTHNIEIHGGFTLFF